MAGLVVRASLFYEAGGKVQGLQEVVHSDNLSPEILTSQDQKIP